MCININAYLKSSFSVIYKKVKYSIKVKKLLSAFQCYVYVLKVFPQVITAYILFLN